MEGTDKRDFLKAFGVGVGIAGITSMMGGRHSPMSKRRGRPDLLDID